MKLPPKKFFIINAITHGVISIPFWFFLPTFNYVFLFTFVFIYWFASTEDGEDYFNSVETNEFFE